MEIDYKNFRGFLKKKSPNPIRGWQKRYFRVLDGKLLVYSKKENDENVKGHIQISHITKATSVERKIFKFALDEREFILQAEDEKVKEQWIEVINRLVTDCDYDYDKIKSSNSQKVEVKPVKTNRMNNIDKKTIELLKNHGYLNTEENQLSKEFINKKGINKLINIKDARVKERINYGFIFRYDMIKNSYEQRWIFLYSRRPVLNEKYEQKEVPLEDPKEKELLKFDCLYFYQVNDKHEATDEMIELHMVDIIKPFNQGDKYMIVLETQGLEIELSVPFKNERDKWVEVLENSRRTAMEYSLSNNKSLKNMQYLDNILLKEGEAHLKEKLEEEKGKVIGDMTKIKDYDILNSISQNLKSEIEVSTYGCIYCCPPKKELLNYFIENYFSSVLLIYQKYFENKYKDIDNFILLKLALDLYSFEEEMKKLLIVDGNIAKNANMFVKIYMRKTYRNTVETIINILKKDFEKRKLKTERGILYSKVLNDIFNVLTKAFDFTKQYLHKYILAQLLIVINEAILQYLLAIDCVLTDYSLLIEKEFIISMGNNCEKFNEYIDKFLLPEVIETKHLSEEEFNESLRVNHFKACIGLVIGNAVLRFVNSIFNDISQSFEEHFLSLDLKMILITTNDIFKHHSSVMCNNFRTQCLEALLQFTVFFYIKSLLSIDNSKKIKIEDLMNKLTKDKSLLHKEYEPMIGQQKTEANVKIISEIIKFLHVNLNSLPSAFTAFREYIGPSFSLLIARLFIKLRTDLNEEEKKYACNKCKEVQLNYKKDKNRKCLGERFFDQLMEDIKVEGDEENIFNQVNERKPNVNKPFIMMLYLNDILNDTTIIEEKEFNREEAIKEMKQLKESHLQCKGIMMLKQFIRYHSYYFELRKGYLLWYKTISDDLFVNRLLIKNVMKIKAKNDVGFSLVLIDKIDKISNKVMKFKVESASERDEWTSAIENEIKLLTVNAKPSFDTSGAVVEIKQRKRNIIDLYQLPPIGKDKDYSKSIIISFIKQENCFGLQKRRSGLFNNEKIEGSEIKQKQNHSFNTTSRPYITKPNEIKQKTIASSSLIKVYCNKLAQVVKQERVFNNIILISFLSVLIIACIYY